MAIQFIARPLTESQKQVIRDLVPILKQEGDQITNEFYKIMVRKYAGMLTFFNKTDQKLMRQPKIMAFCLLRYAECIDDLTPLQDFIDQIVNKHIGLQIVPEHYQYFGEGLIAAFEEMLEEGATPQFLEAWTIAYANLAKLLIDMENKRNALLPWTGFRRFKVVKLVMESSAVRLVYFTPEDPNHRIMMPQPGQYVCIRWMINGEIITREYLVLWIPLDNMYRISVKHLPNGLVLGHVHQNLTEGDILQVAPPGGQFVFSEDPPQYAKKWVFVIGGIGITPTIPIMQRALEQGVAVQLMWSNKTSAVRPFVTQLRQWEHQYPNFSVTEFHTQQEPQDLIGSEGYERRIIYDDIKHFKNSTHYVHLVGPRGFMNEIKLMLDGMLFTNVTAEFYGPTLFLFM